MPYTSTRRYAATMSTGATTPSTSPPTSLSDLSAAIQAGNAQQARDTLRHVPPEELELLDRGLFDDLFALLSSSPHDVTSDFLNPSPFQNSLRLLALHANTEGWILGPQQIRDMFEMRIRSEELRRVVAARSRDFVAGSNTEEMQQEWTDEVYRQFLQLPKEGFDMEERDARTLVRYSVVLARRNGGEWTLAASNYVQAMARTASPLTPSPSLPASHLLRTFFEKGDDAAALHHLDAMISAGQLPTITDMLSIMRSDVELVDPYEEARRVLDTASSVGRTKAMTSIEQLFEDRIEALEKVAYMEREPMLAFITWVAWGREAVAGGAKGRGLVVALRLWEVTFAQNIREGNPPRRESASLLALLVEQACLQESPTGRPVALSPTLRLAIHLAIYSLPAPLLVRHSHLLLRTTCTITQSSTVARTIYEALRIRAPPNSPSPFKWHGGLIEPVFAYLLSNANGGSPTRPSDPAFVLQLYLDLTADGLTLPLGLWPLLWRSLGERGSVEEMGRVMTDYEVMGRVDERIAGMVLSGSVRAGRIVNTLKMLDYFRERSRKGFIDVPLRAYNAILELVASSAEDRRNDGTRVFVQLVEAGHTPDVDTWNAILASHVFRPLIRAQDIDGAGQVYNSLVRSGIRPDGTTFSLLLHGFLRLSRVDKTRTMVEAALRTFHSAEKMGLRIQGRETAALMGGLGRQRRWEEAKEVGEVWWRMRMEEKETGVGLEREERRMKEAGEALLRRETTVRGDEASGRSSPYRGQPASSPEEDETSAGGQQNDDAVSPHAFDLGQSSRRTPPDPIRPVTTFTPNRR